MKGGKDDGHRSKNHQPKTIYDIPKNVKFENKGKQTVTPKLTKNCTKKGWTEKLEAWQNENMNKEN